MSGQTSGSYTIILRMELEPNVAFIQIANAIHEKGGEIVAVDIVNRSKQKTIRDITVSVSNRETEAELIENVRNVPGIKIVNISDRTFLMHLGGKLEVRSKVPIKNR